MELIKFDGLTIPFGELGDNFENIENIQRSEAGSDLGTVTRLQKLTISDSIKCDGHFYKLLQEKGKLLSGICVYKNREFEARLRVSTGGLEKYSEDIPGAEGLWTVAVSIIEV